MQKVLKTQGYAWVQLLLASVYSGAFHPTAEGQAAIADAVVEQGAQGAGQIRDPRACRQTRRPRLGHSDDR